MSAIATHKDIGVTISGHVGQVEIQRPPTIISTMR